MQGNGNKSGLIRFKTLLVRGAILVFALVLFVFLNNTSLFSQRPAGKPKILAHRGLAQTFDIKGLKWDSNTASIIHKPEHAFLENTLPSMRAAFDLGADMVEFDVRLTSDQQLAVFHDFLLDYRTDGKGLVASFTMAELRELDLGYGYTADGGKTYPFRGKGTGLMVSAEEVFAAFPDKSFLIHAKDGGETVGRLLTALFKGKSSEWLGKIGVYGDHDTMMVLKSEFPQLKVLSMQTLKRALISYILLGWTGYIPDSMKNAQIHIPLKYARYLWGWPGKFLNRMDSVNTRLVLVAGDGKWSEGFDTEADLATIPDEFNGYVWTNRVDRIASSTKFRRNIDKAESCIDYIEQTGKLWGVSEVTVNDNQTVTMVDATHGGAGCGLTMYDGAANFVASLTLTVGQSVTLSDGHHASLQYTIKSIGSGSAEIDVLERFDARSFGRGITEKRGIVKVASYKGLDSSPKPVK